MPTSAPLLLACSVALLAIATGVGCGAAQHRQPQQPDAYETFNEDEYGRVQSQGGPVEGGGYYGSGPSGSTPARTPAEPVAEGR